MPSTRMPVFAAGEGAGSLRPPVEVHHFDRHHPRVRAGVHAHQDLEILYFSHGAGEHRVGEQILPFETGDIYLVPPGVPHDLAGIDSAAGWAIEFAPAALGSAVDGGQSLMLWRTNPLLSPFIAADKTTLPGKVSVPEDGRDDWERLLSAMQHELDVRPDGYRLATSAHLVLLLIQVARLARDVTGQLRQRHEPVLAACFEVIERRFGGPLQLGDVARELAISTSHLTDLVRSRTGRTVVDWITERRMSEARRLLLVTDLPADTVARQVGYADPAYFNRRFRQLHGEPPGSWRRHALAGA